MQAGQDELHMPTTSRRKSHANDKTRSSFIPVVESPGPAAYEVATTQTATSPGNVVFGTANRDQEAKRFISKLHSASLPPANTPAPGIYRVTNDQLPHNPKRSYSPTWKFGQAMQRPDAAAVLATRSPGPIYQLPDSPTTPSYSFAPMGDRHLGMHRSRMDTAGVYISAAHSIADRSTSPDIKLGVGPGQYDAPSPTALSKHKRQADVKFTTASRDAKNSLTPLQLVTEPLGTTAADTPFAYDVPVPRNHQTVKFGTGQRTYSPERGPATAGPYIGRLHEAAQRGTDSPGPGSYAVVATSPKNKAVAGWIGDAPTYSFGTGPQLAPERSTLGPGPGAYQAKPDPLSRSFTAPSFSMGPALRGDITTQGRDLAIPGPGAYDVIHETAKSALGFSMGTAGPSGRNSFVVQTPGPGPAAYSSGDTRDTSPSRGYSFGKREKTIHSKSTVTVRYYGPLAAQEARCTQSPGPVYDIREAAGRLSPTRRVPDIKFGTSSRQGARMYISRLHAEAEGLGNDSPGPCAYSHENELSEVTSRYRKAPAAMFSSAPRFK